MKMTYTVAVEMSFYVAYHESGEGGMEYSQYGNFVDDIAKAVELWRDAKRMYPNHEWIICCDPTVTVK